MTAQLLETAANLAEVREPKTDVCATCEETLPLEEMGVDGNGDPQCGDCRSVDWTVEDAAAFRSYMYAGR